MAQTYDSKTSQHLHAYKSGSLFQNDEPEYTIMFWSGFGIDLGTCTR